MKAITGLNHLTLAVRDLGQSVEFYSSLLGFEIRMRGPGSAYLEAGTLWLALVEDATVRNGPLPEYTHIALNIAPDELSVLAEKLTSAGIPCWQPSACGNSFYFLDPDWHKLELHSGTLSSRLAERSLEGQST